MLVLSGVCLFGSDNAGAVTVNYTTDDTDGTSMCALDSTTFVLAYADGTDSTYCFMIYDANGTQLVGETVIDSSNGGSHAYDCISVAALSSSAFVVVYNDGASTGDVIWSIYDRDGDLVTGPVTVDDDVGTNANGVSVSCFSSTLFVVAYVDNTDSDVTFAIYNTDGTLIGGPTDSDAAVGSNAHSVDVDCFNSTRFVIGWFDRSAYYHEFAIYDSSGTAITSATTVDATAGSDGLGMSVSCFDSETFVYVYNDFVDYDTSFIIYDSSGTVLVSETDVDTASASSSGSSQSVHSSILSDSAFVIIWYDIYEYDLSYATYYVNGSLISSGDIEQQTAATTTYRWSSVCGDATAVSIRLYSTNWIACVPTSIAYSAWSGLTVNGAAWNGLDYETDYGFDLTEAADICSDADAYLAFPAVVTAANGDIIILFRNGTTHMGDVGVIDQLTSSDGGLSWTYTSSVMSNSSYDIRDTNDVYLYNDMLIVLPYVYKSSKELAQVWTSSDNGSSWEYHGLLDDLCTGEPSGIQFASVTQMVEVNGTLYASAWFVYDANTTKGNILIRSDDGINWEYVSTISYAGTDEIALIYLGDETFLTVIRETAKTTTYMAVSYDMGETWTLTDAMDELGGVIWQKPQLEWVDEDILVLFGRNYEDLSLGYIVSTDNGTTWSDYEVISDYSSLYTHGGYCSVDLNASGNGSHLLVFYSDISPATTNYPDIWTCWITGGSYYTRDLGAEEDDEGDEELAWDENLDPDSYCSDGDAYSYVFDAGSSATYSLSTDAEWLSIGTSNGTVYGMAESGSYYVNVTATDGETTIWYNYTLRVVASAIDSDTFSSLFSMIIFAVVFMMIVGLIGSVKFKRT